ncbi:MAG: metal-sensitive transcriptional regulator [Patescibacteria group bacterium]
MGYRPKDTKERLLHRLKIARGHLNKVINMVEEDQYCIDVIHQSQAIQKALKEVDNLTLENHLNGCVAESIKNGNKDEAILEVMNIFKKS